jgi:hypothetical protein
MTLRRVNGVQSDTCNDYNPQINQPAEGELELAAIPERP